MCWRRGRDSNPRYAFGVHAISSRTPSASRAPLRCLLCLADPGDPHHPLEPQVASATEREGLRRALPARRPDGSLYARSKSFPTILSNPRYAFGVHAISSRTPSASRAPLLIGHHRPRLRATCGVPARRARVPQAPGTRNLPRRGGRGPASISGFRAALFRRV